MPTARIVEIREILRAALNERPEIDGDFGATAEAYGGMRALATFAFNRIKQLEADIKAAEANGQ